MYKRLFYIALVAAVLMGSSAGYAASPVPSQLGEQVDRLAALFSDGYAVGYPEATMYQVFDREVGEQLVLVVFTIEGWGGGNMFTQFLAAFNRNTDDNGKDYFTFVDAIPIGGKGWRQVARLDAKMIPAKSKGESRFAIDVVVNSDEDAPNFPSRKSAVVVSLKKGKLSEVSAQ